MSQQLYANNATTTLSSSVASTDTSIQVSSTTGWPNPTNGAYFAVTIDSGTNVEVIYVYGVTGTTLTGCLRGQENTVASNFQPGTTIEMRVTAGTLGRFARYQDRLFNVTSVDALLPPLRSDGNSYICTGGDDAGSPIIAIAKLSNETWRFPTYPSLTTSGTAGSTGNTTVFMSLTNASSLIPSPFAGVYIIQFTTGLNAGYARMVTNTSTTGVTWATALPNAVATGDGFEVYQSASSSISNLNASANNGLLFAILFGE
jgi:hypothetical protein